MRFVTENSYNKTHLIREKHTGLCDTGAFRNEERKRESYIFMFRFTEEQTVVWTYDWTKS